MGGMKRHDFMRIDRHGTTIVKGTKGHKISFADNIQEDKNKLAEVYFVESYKKFNQENTYGH